MVDSSNPYPRWLVPLEGNKLRVHSPMRIGVEMGTEVAEHVVEVCSPVLNSRDRSAVAIEES